MCFILITECKGQHELCLEHLNATPELAEEGSNGPAFVISSPSAPLADIKREVKWGMYDL